jgi:hypothetical protein
MSEEDFYQNFQDLESFLGVPEEGIGKSKELSYTSLDHRTAGE